MALGNFLGKLKSKEKPDPQQFLALTLTDEVVQAAVWSITLNQTEIIALGVPVEWDGDTGTTSELVTAVDATISSATDGLAEEPSSVILGIPASWSDKNGVLGVKRGLINQIRKELELTALGYVTITDSILSYLKLQEGTPSTSILIHVSRDEFSLSLVRLGRTEAIESIGRSDDVVEDITEGITRFKNQDNLPSRIILFNSMHGLDEIIQNLLSVDWQKDFNFLHIPKIEALPKDVAIRALVVAGGSEVAKSLGFAVEEVIPESPKSTMPATLLTPEEIGFTSSPSPKVDFIDPEDEPEDTPSVEAVQPSPRLVIPKFKLPNLSLPKIKFNFSGIKRHWWILGALLTTLIMLIVYLVWFMPRASLNVQVTPKTLDENVELTLSTTASGVDFTDRIVPATTQAVQETGEKTVSTTGKKTVGESATGEVTLYNRTTSTKNFAKGTTLALGKLKFALDSDVTVASKSAGSDYIDVPGKASVGISALAIGAESNLPSGTEFVIASFSKDSYVGKNDAALTGGTSEEIQVVGKDDQKILVKDLTAEIMETLASQAQTGDASGIGTYLIPSSIKINSEEYSAKVGDAATSLTLNLSLSAMLLRYQTSDVTNLVNSTIDASVPAGYIRANLPSTVELTAKSSGTDDSNVEGNAKVTVSLLPVLDLALLKSSLTGKKLSVAQDILSQSVPGYLTSDIDFLPRFLPPRVHSLPYNPRNLTINLTPAL